jgi:hypothetical protein
VGSLFKCNGREVLRDGAASSTSLLVAHGQEIYLLVHEKILDDVSNLSTPPFPGAFQIQMGSITNWATRPCAVSVEECSVGRRTGNAGLEMKNI